MFHFGQCKPPLLLSTCTVYLQATEAHSNLIGQYGSVTRILSLANRLCLHVQISVYGDYINEYPRSPTYLWEKQGSVFISQCPEIKRQYLFTKQEGDK